MNIICNAAKSDSFRYLTVVRLYPVTVTASFSQDNATPRIHTCLSRKVYTKFGIDNAIGFSGDEEVQNSSSDEDNTPSLSDRQHRSSHLIPSAGTSSNVSQPTITATTTTSSTLQRSSSLSTFSFVPSAIWKEPWVAQTGPYRGVVSLDNISNDVYEVATSDVIVDELDVRAPDMAGLVSSFRDMLAAAAHAGDFTNLLSTERAFYL